MCYTVYNVTNHPRAAAFCQLCHGQSGIRKAQNMQHANQEASPTLTEQQRRRGKSLLAAFLAVFLLLTALITALSVIGATGSYTEKLAMDAISVAYGELGADGAVEVCRMHYLDAPEKPEGSYGVARAYIRFTDGKEGVFTIKNNGEITQLTTDESTQDWETIHTGNLFAFRSLYQNGVLSRLTVQSPAMAIFLVGGLVALIGYLLGSINTGALLSRFIFHDDIRKKGSGNPGATNMLRTFGVKASLLTLWGDMLKVTLALTMVSFLCGAHYRGAFAGGSMLYLCGLCAVVGHIVPLYAHFKGGKGVTCAAALALYTSPIVFAIMIAIFILMVALTRYVSLSSITAGLLYPLVFIGALNLWGMTVDAIPLLCVLTVGLLILLCHRGNIKRLMAGTERKFSLHKKG